MRPSEWLNERLPFFPFLPDDSNSTVLLNKEQVLLVSLPTVEAPAEEVPPAFPGYERKVVVECGPRVIEGSFWIQLPEDRRRALDFLNQCEFFVPLHVGGRQHFVQKRRITRVVEVG